MDKFSVNAVNSQLRILRAILCPTKPGVVVPQDLRAQALHEVNEMVAALRVAREEMLKKFDAELLAQQKSLRNVSGLFLRPTTGQDSDTSISPADWQKCETALRLTAQAGQLDESQRHLTRYIEMYFNSQIRKFETLSGVLDCPVGA